MSNSELIRDLVAIAGEPNVVHRAEDLIVFEYDGSVDRALPTVVVLPRTTAEVSDVVKTAGAHGVPVVARGAGTYLAEMIRLRGSGMSQTNWYNSPTTTYQSVLL